MEFHKINLLIFFFHNIPLSQSELLKLAIWVYFTRLARTASVHPELREDGIVVNLVSTCLVLKSLLETRVGPIPFFWNFKGHIHPSICPHMRRHLAKFELIWSHTEFP